MLISAEITDYYGIKEATADMGGIETIKLECEGITCPETEQAYTNNSFVLKTVGM